MTLQTPYPIGTPGQPWGDAERVTWRSLQQHKRSYADDVLTQIERLGGRFDVLTYGADGKPGGDGFGADIGAWQ